MSVNPAIAIWMFLVWLLAINLFCNVNGDKSCRESLGTLSEVLRCPNNEREWIRRAYIKNCSSINQTCSESLEFQYHCVLDEYGTRTIEVCAPVWYLQGYCASFKESKKRIGNFYDMKCSEFEVPCPPRFLSNDSFKYQDCYTFPENGKPPSIIQFSTKSSAEETLKLALSFGIGIPVFVAIVGGIVWRVHKYQKSRKKQNNREKNSDVNQPLTSEEKNNEKVEQNAAERDASLNINYPILAKNVVEYMLKGLVETDLSNKVNSPNIKSKLDDNLVKRSELVTTQNDITDDSGVTEPSVSSQSTSQVVEEDEQNATGRPASLNEDFAKLPKDFLNADPRLTKSANYPNKYSSPDFQSKGETIQANKQNFADTMPKKCCNIKENTEQQMTTFSIFRDSDPQHGDYKSGEKPAVSRIVKISDSTNLKDIDLYELYWHILRHIETLTPNHPSFKSVAEVSRMEDSTRVLTENLSLSKMDTRPAGKTTELKGSNHPTYTVSSQA